MSTRRTYRKAAAPKPVILPEPPDMRKAKHLPMFGPGIVISIPLHLWPAYRELYHLEKISRSNKPGVDLFVKREEPKHAND